MSVSSLHMQKKYIIYNFTLQIFLLTPHHASLVRGGATGVNAAVSPPSPTPPRARLQGGVSVRHAGCSSGPPAPAT